MGVMILGVILMDLKVLAPAKINLSLEIGNKNSSGYHEVDMVMQSISLYDEIELCLNENTKIDLSVDKNLNCPTEKNIAYKAAKKFFDYTGIKNKGINIKIKKNIPVCAGLAGGSADGAGIIIGLNKLFDTNLNPAQTQKIGAKIGADVPFCISGGTAYAYGIGTELKQLKLLPTCNIVVVKPDISISTAKSYSDFDNMEINQKYNTNPLIAALKSQNLTEICKNLFNRFEDVINEPEIFKIKNDLIKHGALNSLMTGSGSAVYGIFNDYEKAQNCVEIIKKEYPATYFTQPINHGAEIL